MKNLVKVLIVWLMLVAIPFQGYAAASMLPCAPAQVTTANIMSNVAMDMSAEHCAHMPTAAPQQVDQTDHSAPHHGKCSACASCFGAVMAPPMPVVPVPHVTPELALFHFTVGHVARVDLALPERPPKLSLT